jgi:hypothetical protein
MPWWVHSGSRSTSLPKKLTPGTLTRMVVSGLEGLVFGIGVVLGVTRRPRGSGAGLPPA